MKCPNCGNTNISNFTPSKQDYMSAFTLDTPLVKCKYCGKEFEDTSIIPIEEIKIGPTKEKDLTYQSYPGQKNRKFPSQQLPPLDTSKASEEMLSRSIPGGSSLQDLNASNRQLELDIKNLTKQKELESWVNKEPPEFLWKKERNISRMPSAYNPVNKKKK